MLEDLSTIEWVRLHHAYGPADDVPDQLRVLASTDSDARKEALEELESNIWHQNTIYEATPYALPFLIELVKNQVPDSHSLLALIAEIVRGGFYLDVDVEDERNGTPEHLAKLRQELQFVQLARQAVIRHARPLLDLMESEDRFTRELSIFILLTSAGIGSEAAHEVLESIFKNSFRSG